MISEKKLNTLLSIIFSIIILICVIVILGMYMNEKWQGMRDIRRRSDIETIRKAVNFYQLNYNKLPPNETDEDWDLSYDSENNNQTLFKTLREEKILSPVFDPKNDSEHHYRYHYFEKGEYGCEKAFAIFQVVDFEGQTEDHGRGDCPYRDFVAEVPNGYTIQWFE